jgi:hypothetical protein
LLSPNISWGILFDNEWFLGYKDVGCFTYWRLILTTQKQLNREEVLALILAEQINTVEQNRIYLCIEEGNAHDFNSFGHAFIMGITLNTNKTHILNNQDAFGPELKNCIGFQVNGKRKIWTYSLYPDFADQGSVTINDEKDFRRAERILFGRDGVQHSFDGFVCEVVSHNLFSQTLITTPSRMCDVERALRNCNYNLILANCIKFASEQFAIVTGVFLNSKSKIKIFDFDLGPDAYLPETLLRQVKDYKSDRRFNPEAAKIARLDVANLSASEMMDLLNPDPQANAWAALDAEIALKKN